MLSSIYCSFSNNFNKMGDMFNGTKKFSKKILINSSHYRRSSHLLHLYSPTTS